MSRLKKFICNAALLTFTSLFMRAVSLSFNVWISNKVGAEALGLFSLISGVYSFALTLALSGISLATTRMVAEALGHNDKALAKASVRKCLTYSLFFGFLSSTLLLIFAEPISINYLQDARSVKPLQIMAITLPLISLCSAMNGYFTAVRRVAKNAASQIIEQAVKITVTVVLLLQVFPDGIENACLALVIGTSASETVSFLIMSIMFFFDERKHLTPKKHEGDKSKIRKKLLGIALPVAFSTYIRSGLLTLEHMLIPIGLRKSGASKDKALASYGILNSMVFPVILFPSALISSFAGMSIPEISDCMARGHKKRIEYISKRVWQFSLIFSIGVSGILICFSSELGDVLYSNKDASLYIRLLAPLVPVMYLDSTTDALLKGLGEQVYSMNVNIIDALISVIAVYFTVPVFGIHGYIFVVILMELLNFSLSAIRMLNISGMKVKIFSWIVKPIACITVSTFIVRSLSSRFSFFDSDWLSLILHLTLSAFLYIIFILMFNVIDKEDRSWIKNVFSFKDLNYE